MQAPGLANFKRRHGPEGGRGRTCAYFSFATVPSRYANCVQILEMCGALTRLGYRTTLFASLNPRYDGAWHDVLRDYGVDEAIRVRWLAPVGGVWRMRMKVFFITCLSAGANDLCYTRHALAAAACVLRRRPCIYEMHSPHLARLDRACLWVVKRSRYLRIVAISNVLASMASQAHGIPLDQIVVEHDACRMPAEATSAVKQGGHRLLALYVGSFYEGRGLDTFLRLASIHTDVDFLAVGGTAKEAGAPIPRNLRVVDRVPHSKVPMLLASADVLLMPYGKRVTIDGKGDTSRYCSPLKLFEYLSAGRAIVSTRTESIAEVLRHGENALLVEAEDVEAWAAAIASLRDDPGLRERLSRAALDTAREHTWDLRVRRILRDTT